MSVTEIKYTTRSCDFCGKEIKETARCREGFRYAILRLDFECWYDAKRTCTDICEECNQKICTFLYENGFLDYGVKVK